MRDEDQSAGIIILSINQLCDDAGPWHPHDRPAIRREGLSCLIIDGVIPILGPTNPHQVAHLIE